MNVDQVVTIRSGDHRLIGWRRGWPRLAEWSLRKKSKSCRRGQRLEGDQASWPDCNLFRHGWWVPAQRVGGLDQERDWQPRLGQVYENRWWLLVVIFRTNGLANRRCLSQATQWPRLCWLGNQLSWLRSGRAHRSRCGTAMPRPQSQHSLYVWVLAYGSRLV